MSLTRRDVLVGAGAVFASFALNGCGSLGAGASPTGRSTGDRGRWCVAPSAVVEHASIGRATLVYDPTKTSSAFGFDPGFYVQLERWLADWNRSRYGGVGRLWTYGSYVEGGSNCHSYHAASRAIDISRLFRGSAGSPTVSCRHDLWKTLPAAQQRLYARRYWTLAASLHLHFAYVLTYYYDALHDNHIHVDNGLSGNDFSHFDPASEVQCQAVQAIASTIWGCRARVTGRYDDTEPVAAEILKRLGRSGSLTSQPNWQAFLRASVQLG